MFASKRTFVCRSCGERAEEPEEGDENYGTSQCYHCFCKGVEEYEEKRRERIARENEY